MSNLVVKFESIEQVYRAYMPFIQPAGLFITTNEIFDLGQEVMVTYSLPDSTEAFVFTGQVVWLNPLSASGGRPAGVGVKISTEPESHKYQIEQFLSHELSSGHLTCTM